VWLLGAYLRCAGREAVPARVSTPGQVAAERAVAFIQKQHHRVDLDLGDIAKEARVSEAYLCRVFRKVTGMTPRSYLNAFRIERSQLLLHEGRLNCTEIADTCGFSSVHHFSKVFKQLHGVAPTHWRSSLR
jgi:AraC-like DNA-binding protein